MQGREENDYSDDSTRKFDYARLAAKELLWTLKCGLRAAFFVLRIEPCAPAILRQVPQKCYFAQNSASLFCAKWGF